MAVCRFDERARLLLLADVRLHRDGSASARCDLLRESRDPVCPPRGEGDRGQRCDASHDGKGEQDRAGSMTGDRRAEAVRLSGKRDGKECARLQHETPRKQKRHGS